jgi:hypothetical protein
MLTVGKDSSVDKNSQHNMLLTVIMLDGVSAECRYAECRAPTKLCQYFEKKRK